MKNILLLSALMIAAFYVNGQIKPLNEVFKKYPLNPVPDYYKIIEKTPQINLINLLPTNPVIINPLDNMLCLITTNEVKVIMPTLKMKLKSNMPNPLFKG